MRYKAFHFTNFKGIRELSLELTGDVTTLIGLNESGKTTILEAIFCFSYGAENLDVINPGMASLRDPEQWIPISKRANFNDTISICAIVSLDADDKIELEQYMRKNHSIRVVDLPDEVEICEHYPFENSRYIKAKTRRLWGLTLMATAGQQRRAREYVARTVEWQAAIAHLKERLPRIWYFPNFLFELPEKFVLDGGGTVGVTAEERDKSQFYRATFEQVLGQLSIDANLDEHVVQRLRSDEKADQRNLRSVLLDMGRVISGTILEGWSRIFGSAPAGQEVELLADTTPSGDAYLELKIKGADGYYDLSERSLGFRWFFMFLLMTSYRGIGTGDGPRALFLLDEPASNLHSTAQAELLKSFENLARTCHLVYTTHSHHLINLRWLDAAYVVKNEALQSFSLEDYLSTRMGAQTSISATRYRRFVAENPAETSYIQPVLDLLEYRPSDLEPVPDVVLVEGKIDFYLLRYMTEVLGLASDLHLVPGTGAGSLDPLIKLHIGWGKTFLVLLDGDAEGQRQRERYEEAYGPVMHGRCLLLPELAGSGIDEAEDLLSEADKMELLKLAFPGATPKPGKKVVASAVLELYATRQVFEVEAVTRGRFEDLLAALTSAFDERGAK